MIDRVSETGGGGDKGEGRGGESGDPDNNGGKNIGMVGGDKKEDGD